MANETITLAETKLHLRVDVTDDDDLIDTLIGAALEIVEAWTWRKIGTGTLTQYCDSFPSSGIIQLKSPPLTSVTSITYIDTNGDTQTLSTDIYDVDITTEPGSVRRAYDQSWPSTRAENNAVTITYVAGYADANSTPDTIKQAMLLLIGHWYANREQVFVGPRAEATEVPMAVQTLLRRNTVETFV